MTPVKPSIIMKPVIVEIVVPIDIIMIVVIHKCNQKNSANYETIMKAF